jgi:hypothetical protein
LSFHYGQFLEAKPETIPVKLVSFDFRDLRHYTALYQLLEYEACVHGEKFTPVNFRGVLEALRAKKIEALFLEFDEARKGICDRAGNPTTIVGATIKYPSVLAQWDAVKGKTIHEEVEQQEDTVLNAYAAELYRKLTKSPQHPKGQGLGTRFEAELIKHGLAKGLTTSIGECAANNQPAKGLWTKLNAIIGSGTILELHGLTQPMMERLPDDPKHTGRLYRREGILFPGAFTSGWKSDNGKYKIDLTLIDGFSTFKGFRRLDVQITNSKGLPDNPAEIRHAVASLLVDAWIRATSPDSGFAYQSGNIPGLPSPIVPASAPSRNVIEDAITSAHDEILLRVPYADMAHTLKNAPALTMQIKAEDERIISALIDLGVPIRKLGEDNSYSVVLTAKGLPDALKIDMAIPEASRLRAVDLSEIAYEPVFFPPFAAGGLACH